MGEQDLERRLIECDTAVERCLCDQTGKKKVVIRGYAALFNSDSQDLGGFVERVAPGAFDNVIKRGTDVVALYNHEPMFLLGRESAGTLRLSVDDRGLRYEIDAPDSRADVVEAIERGDVRGSSFAFRVKSEGEKWTRSADGKQLREIIDFDGLFDVGPVLRPAYPATESFVSRRALDYVRAADKPPVAAEDPAEQEGESPAQDDAAQETLSPSNFALYEAIEKIAIAEGKWPQDGAYGAHYIKENPFAGGGIRCENCIFFNQGGSCDVVEGDIDAEAICKLWIIPEERIASEQGAPEEEPAMADGERSIDAAADAARLTARALEAIAHARRR